MHRSVVLFLCGVFLTQLQLTWSWHGYDNHRHAHMKVNRNCHVSYKFEDSVTTEEDQKGKKRSHHERRHRRRRLNNEDTTSTGSSSSGGEEEEFDPSCPCYHEATRPYPKEFSKKLKLWPGVTSEFDHQHGETLYGSQYTLEEIHKSQNPENCSEAKFLINGGWPYGFGSRVHMEGLALSIAMHLGRVYLPHPDGDNIFWETNVPFCRNIRKDHTLTCFYEAFSKCTIQDALRGTGGDVNHLRTYYPSDFKASFESEHDLEQTLKSLEHIKSFNLVMTYGGGPYNSMRYLPHQIRPILQCSPMHENMYAYWWRAVTATYIARPNNVTAQLMDKLQYDTLHNNPTYGLGASSKFAPKAEEVVDPADRIKAPMPAKFKNPKNPGNDADKAATTTRDTTSQGNSTKTPRFDGRECVAMFVRHGDKGIEMKLLEFLQYYEVAQQMWNGGLVPESSKLIRNHIPPPDKSTGYIHALDHYHNWTEIIHLSNWSVPLNGTLFITTEDPAVLDQALHVAGGHRWEVIATNLFDRASQTAYKTWDEQHKKGTRAVHDDYEYISMMLNLHLSLQCEAWVCTLASNSCRIMDELRATVGAKANRYYADLSIETCTAPPCILDHGHLQRLGGC